MEIAEKISKEFHKFYNSLNVKLNGLETKDNNNIARNVLIGFVILIWELYREQNLLVINEIQRISIDHNKKLKKIPKPDKEIKQISIGG